MKSAAGRRLLLVLAAAAFIAWIGWLGYLVATTAGPEVQIWPFRISKTPTVILSRPQFLVSSLDIIAEVKEADGRPDAEVTVQKVHWPPDEQDQLVHHTITISNLAECDGWAGPGRYILALVNEGKHYEVARTPRSPGFEPHQARRPHIYPLTPQTERQLEEIHKPVP